MTKLIKRIGLFLHNFGFHRWVEIREGLDVYGTVIVIYECKICGIWKCEQESSELRADFHTYENIKKWLN